MDALTQNQQPHMIKHTASKMYNPIPLRWRVVLDYHLAGHKKEEIALITGYSVNSVYRILNHQDVVQVRQQLMEHTQKEFEALQAKVVDSIRDDLDSADPARISDARKDWLRAHGKVKENKSNEFTAENMVVQMLNGDVVNDQGN